MRPRYLGREVATNDLGVAVVFHIARWGGHGDAEAGSYSRSLGGTIVVKMGDQEVYRKDLSTWAEENAYVPSASSAPSIIVEVKR